MNKSFDFLESRGQQNLVLCCVAFFKKSTRFKLFMPALINLPVGPTSSMMRASCMHWTTHCRASELTATSNCWIYVGVSGGLRQIGIREQDMPKTKSTGIGGSHLIRPCSNATGVKGKKLLEPLIYTGIFQKLSKVGIDVVCHWILCHASRQPVGL
jgi:hypothetical protein